MKTVYAFPQPIATFTDGSMYCSSEKHPDFAGMELRDYFAAKIISGLLAQEDGRYFDEKLGGTFDDWQAKIIKTDVAYAYKIADEMLAARSAEEE